MAIQAMALGVQNPEINALGALAAGQQARQSFDMNNVQIAKAGLETIGSIALGAMGGKIDGQADPKLFNEGLDYLAQQGVSVDQFRDRADLAPVIARSSMTALQQMSAAHDEKTYQLALDNFELEVMKAAQGPAPTAEMRNFDWAAGDPTKEAFVGIGEKVGARPLAPEERAQWGIPETDTGAYSISPGKPPERVGGAPAGAAGFNVSQAAAAGYADRMTQSDAILSSPGLLSAQTDRGQQMLSGTPLVGNSLVSSEYQQADQAKRDFINALLRRESGAVISDGEFDNANKQYFPQPGDNEDVLKQKAANRRNSIAGISRQAGPAYTQPDTTNYLTGATGATSTPAAPGAAPAAQSGGLPNVGDDAAYDALSSGEHFLDPEGNERIKP